MTPMTRADRLVLTALLCLLSMLSFHCSDVFSHSRRTLQRMQKDSGIIAAEMQRVLDTELGMWYPLSLDTVYGGFFSDVNEQWALDGPQNKMIVTQARHVWTAAHALQFRPGDPGLLRAGVHGFHFLKTTMWDSVYGGFFDLTDRRGRPVTEGGEIIKRAYGNAFGVYALAAYYKATGDTCALRLAQAAFSWLEEHSYDAAFGGYFQFMKRDGTPFVEGYGGTPPKDQNSTIHLLECYSELYGVWPDRRLEERLRALVRIVRDTMTTDAGCQRLFFCRDWTPVSYRDASSGSGRSRYEFDHISFGHDIETAYLLLEAERSLGEFHDSTTLRIARKKVDFVLAHGWDDRAGGVYDRGTMDDATGTISILLDTKEWWAQAEALNSLLLMSVLFPQDEHRYFEKFCMQWDYCRNFVIDTTRGGWYHGGTDKEPDNIHSPKGSIWKAAYHTSRSLISCIGRLRAGPGALLLWDDAAYSPHEFEPVNRSATPEARRLLQFLYAMRGRKIIAGHHNSVENPDTFITRVRELTGKGPQIWGCDFIGSYVPGNAERIVREASRKYRQGYIVTLMWHAGRPQDDPPFGWKESVQAKMTDEQWKELTTPGTALHTRWLHQVDTVAVYLKKLRDLGVPVLWRPYHELNGVWFWWGNRKGEHGSAALWRMLYDRFVRYHGLNNLIWVWNTNAPRDLPNDEAFAYEDYFPGLDHVDVLAADVYHNDYKQSHHDQLAALARGKLIALGEVGEVPSPAVLANQPLWSWFMIWSNFVNTHNTPRQIRDLYDCPRVLTHEECAAGK